MSTRQKTSFAALALLLVALGIVGYWLAPRTRPEAATQLEASLAQLGALPTAPAPFDPDHVPTKANFGYEPDAQAIAATLEMRSLRDLAPHLFGIDGHPVGDAEPVLLYRAHAKAYAAHYGRPFIVGRQGIGDCVSWGWAHGADHLLAVDLMLGKTGRWHDAATESIYGGSRVEARGRSSGGWGDGSYGGAAAKWVRDWGIIYRQPYAGADLTTYSAQRAKQWGNYGNGGQGDDGKLDAVAREHPVKTVALVTTFDEAAAAISSGYPIPVCSGQGFSSTRDQWGEAAPRGSWAHCMVFIGYRPDLSDQQIEHPPGSGNYVRGPPAGLLCLNSWGPSWIRGPKWPADQPDGSFWVDVATCTRMLRGRDSYAMSGYVGFPLRKLRHSEGW